MSEQRDVSIEEAIAFWERDESQLYDVALGELIVKHSISKIVYRQKTVGVNEFKIEVLPKCEGELEEKTQEMISHLCREFARNSYFDIYEGIQGVIYLQDGKVRFTGDKLSWEPLILE